MNLDLAREKAASLIEALPYLQQFRGETFLIKMGGSAMENPKLVEQLMRDIVFLEVAGINPVIVHGGGKAISAAMLAAGLEAEFIGGFRVTTKEAIEIVEKTLNGEVNPSIVEMINTHQGKAQGLKGQEVFCAKKLYSTNEEGESVDIGSVGEVIDCNIGKVEDLIAREIVPVISPIGLSIENNSFMNVNADLAAAALAKALKPAKLIYISDVPGLMRDPANADTLIPSLNAANADTLIEEKVISGGMIPKVKSALDALEAGVEKVHFIDGRVGHTLLLEIFTDSGIGTEIVKG